MSRNFFMAAAAGQFSYLGVFNNATDGSYLFIQSLRYTHLAITDTVFVGTVGGNPLSSTFSGNQLDPGMGAGYGLMGGLQSASDLLLVVLGAGPASAELGSHSTTFYDWPFDFPAAVLPPGYTCLLQTHAQNQDLGGTFWWYSLPY